MEDHIEKYAIQFQAEQLELIVRIAWCAKKRQESCFIGQARFDMALNVRTGDLLGMNGVAANWLVCRTSDDKCAYRFREGKLYRVLVRECVEKEDKKYKAYYVDKVLQRNVKEPLLKQKKHSGMICFYPQGKNQNPKKTITIDSPFGKFKWNKNYHYFEGEIDYLGEACTVRLETDKGEPEADAQLERLSGICMQLEKWDCDVKEYAADNLLSLANEWREDSNEITKEEFIQRIGTPDITINADMSIQLMFNSDEMFTDHSIEIDIDKNDNFTGTDIVG